MGESDEKTTVHIQVPKSKKESWKEYADDAPEIPGNNLSQLIRTAVSNEIAGRESGDTEPLNSDAFADVLEQSDDRTQKTVRQIQEQLNAMDGKLEEIRRNSDTAKEERPLADRLWEALPPAKPESPQWERARPADGHDAWGAIHFRTAWSGTVEDICKRVGERTETVEEKLDELGVPSVEIDGRKRYYMEEL